MWLEAHLPRGPQERPFAAANVEDTRLPLQSPELPHGPAKARHGSQQFLQLVRIVRRRDFLRIWIAAEIAFTPDVAVVAPQVGPLGLREVHAATETLDEDTCAKSFDDAPWLLGVADGAIGARDAFGSHVCYSKIICRFALARRLPRRRDSPRTRVPDARPLP